MNYYCSPIFAAENHKTKKDTAKALTQFGLYSVDGLGSSLHPQQEHHTSPVIKVM